MKNSIYIIVAFAGLVVISTGRSVSLIEDGSGNENRENRDTKHSRVVWIGSGNQFGNSTGSSGDTSNPDPGNPVTCTSNGYVPDPDSTSSYYICKFNAVTGNYDITKQSCSPGSNFQPIPPKCVI